MKVNLLYMDNINNEIDKLLNIRQKGIINYAISTKELINLGVKIKNKETNNITLPTSFEKYLDKYNISNLEFEWEAYYKNGSIIRQFEGKKEINWKNINQNELSSISLISNFNWPSEKGVDSRIIVKLNFETGLFEFINGFISQEVRTEACTNPLLGNKKLILKVKHRVSDSNGELDDQYKDFFPFENETFFYNRFILGYEVDGIGEKSVIINPDGKILNFNN